MSLRYVRELNNGRINIRPITFWQAFGLSFLFDYMLMIIAVPTDIFIGLTSRIGDLGNNTWQYILSTVLTFLYQYGALLVLIIFINRSLNVKENTELRVKITKKDYVVASIIVVSYLLITYGWFDYFLYSIPTGDFLDEMLEYIDSLPIFILLIESCVIAPIFEEILYRGILLNGLLKRYSAKKAIIYSALIFAIAHMNLPQGINAFFLAIIFGTIFYYTKSIYICMIMHFTNNLLVNIIVYPEGEMWTKILFIVLPIVGIILMVTCFKILKFKERC